jgi:hypothetical protein
LQALAVSVQADEGFQLDRRAGPEANIVPNIEEALDLMHQGGVVGLIAPMIDSTVFQVGGGCCSSCLPLLHT